MTSIRSKLHRFLFDTYVQDPSRFPVPTSLVLGWNTLKRRAIRRFRVRHTLQVSSFGGAGTTLLTNFLQRHGADLPDQRGARWAPWKHMSAPPENRVVPSGFRAIYVIGDPRDALLSVFRRGYQHAHVQLMEGRVHEWDFTWKLTEYLAEGRELFGFGEHFDRWVRSDRNYPILVVKYDALWDNLPEIIRFAGLPESVLQDFPERKPRATDRQHYPPEITARVDRMLGELAERIDRYPDFSIIGTP
ncbi:sulfotransferase domain-containing protein [Lewinella sp. JB7]|uniref:sulfotransferase domain-containing protein n=1 Tax=Lewinella sp. JB7 TaxID=2962887 RepID=UPI0020C9DA4B|nr:sulfotransferase domain-containing protein [Lewinella sp. JB7]MCP9237070.1 sulfotransferase domain-containing protein [Lewinella sp. JB7]